MHLDQSLPNARRRRRARRSLAVPVVIACLFAGGIPAASGAEAPTASRAVTRAEAPEPWTSTTDFVRQTYIDLLRRTPSNAEVEQAAARITAGQTPAAFVAEMVDSLEMQVHVKAVVRLYRAYYLRNPDHRGLAHWIAQSRAGWTLPRISNEFAAAPEFAVRYGTLTDDRFVDLVYQNVLGRLPDVAGRRYWMGRIAEGLYRGQLMTSFSESPEYVRKSTGTTNLVALYDGLFQVSVPRGQSDYYSSALQNGTLTTLELARQFLNDRDYTKRFD